MPTSVGGAQTLSKMRERFPGSYPRALVRGRGARVRDNAGKWYVDWSCALGAVSLGYNHPGVDAAVVSQVRDGPIFSLPDFVLEETTAYALVDMIPCAESVRFLKTGSEATEAAIRVARAYTGRDVVVACGYHGWHSWYAATREHAPGVPEAYRDLVRTFAYNDLASLDRALNWADGSDVAAIILEPTLFEPPAVGFLEGVQARAAAHGALLIFDEMVTGFRWHRGGYQALCGVIPDLATFGKGLGNGYPIAALVGRAEPMRWARLASGTFGGDCVGLAAARATIDAYHDADVCGHMARVGADLMIAYNAMVNSARAPSRAEGQPPHPRIIWDEEGFNRHRASLFFQECARRGVLFHPDGINVMLAHGPGELQVTIDACAAALTETVEAIARGTVLDLIEGDPISPLPPWRSAPARGEVA